VVEFGNYSWMWYADMALAAMAALVNLPIREARWRPPGGGLNPSGCSAAVQLNLRLIPRHGLSL
jgi:hypothetical protein